MRELIGFENGIEMTWNGQRNANLWLCCGPQ